MSQHLNPLTPEPDDLFHTWGPFGKGENQLLTSASDFHMYAHLLSHTIS